MSKEFRTSIGGQALMEGIMMRGPEKICCAVRKPDGTIDLTYDTVTVHWYNRVPLVRGVCNMAENLYKGYRYLMHAADIAMEGETEPAESKLDKWFEEHATPAVQNVLMTCAAFVGILLASRIGSPWVQAGIAHVRYRVFSGRRNEKAAAAEHKSFLFHMSIVSSELDQAVRARVLAAAEKSEHPLLI